VAIAALLVGAILLFLFPVPRAPAATRAQPPGVHLTTCSLNGPRWTIFDAHGGSNPKQIGAGTLYRVSVQVFNTPGSYSCTWATAAVKRMFPEITKRPHTAVVLRSGPPDFVCRSSGEGPPETGAGGRCTRAVKVGTGVLLIWQSVGLH